MRHNDYRLKKTAVGRLKAEMNQWVAFHTQSVPLRDWGDDTQARLVTICFGAENIAIPIRVVGEWSNAKSVEG